jgi:hypothetical protein
MPPSAVGTLARTPLVHALVYVRNKRLTGRFELRASGSRSASLTFFRGRISSVTVAPAVAYFGSVAYEMGFITAEMLDRSLLELAVTNPKRLHGDILLALGAINERQRDEVLHEQVCRKVHHLFTLPDETTYEFHDVRPGVQDPPMLVDPIAPAWRGLRDYPPASSIDEVIARLGPSPLRMVNEDAVDRARLAPPEAQLAKRLAERPLNVAQLRLASPLPAGDVDLLVYLLVIAKCVEPMSGVKAAPSIGEMPATAAPSIPPMPAAPPRASQSGSMPAVRAASSTLPPPMSSSSSIPPPLTRTLTPPVLGPTELGPSGIAARAKKVGTEDYFAILGVDRNATSEAVRAAYIRLAKVWHPDKLPIGLMPFRDEVAQIYAHMTRAQQTLCDPEAKRQWMEGHGIGLRKRPREEIIHDIELALGRGEWAAAEREARRLAESDPNDGDALALLAWTSARGGDAPDDTLRMSLMSLDRAVHIDRTCERALYLRGCLAKRLGKVDAAFRDFARVVHLNPNNVDALREVRLIEMRQRKGSGEHPLGGVSALVDRFTGKKDS